MISKNLPALPSTQIPDHSGSKALARIDQSRSAVQGSQIAGDQNNFYAPPPASPIEKLLSKLDSEIEKQQHIQHTIDRLLRFQKAIAPDGVSGLEAKLVYANREGEIYEALEKKEVFAKLLEKYSLYASAQELFVVLLARAEYQFSRFVYPQVDALSIVEINALIDERIVAPTVQECGASVVAIDHNVALGMIFWLAEQCYVRWHQ